MRRMQLNVAKSKAYQGHRKLPHLIKDHSLGSGVDFTEGGKPESPENSHEF